MSTPESCDSPDFPQNPTIDLSEFGENVIIPPDFDAFLAALAGRHEKIEAAKNGKSLLDFADYLEKEGIGKLRGLIDSGRERRVACVAVLQKYIDIYTGYVSGVRGCLEEAKKAREMMEKKEQLKAEAKDAITQFLMHPTGTLVVAKSRVEAEQWANVIIKEMEANGLPLTAEMVALVIITIKGESRFTAEGLVPQSSEMVDRMLKTAREEYSARIQAARIYDNELVIHFESYIPQILAAKSEKDLEKIRRRIKADPKLLEIKKIPFIGEKAYTRALYEIDKRITTAGSMQVNVQKALKMARAEGHNYTDEQMRDLLYTVEGGIHYGMKMFADIAKIYAVKDGRGVMQLTRERAEWIMGDYNMGEYSSRNAAVQHMLNSLMRGDLVTDGDLMDYRPEEKAEHNTKKAFIKFARKHAPHLKDADVERDLLKEKSTDFVETALYRALVEAYRKNVGAPLWAELANAAVNKEAAMEKYGREPDVKKYTKIKGAMYENMIKRFATVLPEDRRPEAEVTVAIAG